MNGPLPLVKRERTALPSCLADPVAHATASETAQVSDLLDGIACQKRVGPIGIVGQPAFIW